MFVQKTAVIIFHDFFFPDNHFIVNQIAELVLRGQ